MAQDRQALLTAELRRREREEQLRSELQRRGGPPIMRGEPTTPLQNGMDLPQRQSEGFPEVPYGMTPEAARQASSGEGALQFREPGQMSQDKYGNQTFTRGGQQYYFNDPGKLNATDVIETGGKVLGAVEEAAPYLHTGVGTAAWTGIGGGGRAMLAQGATGLLEETADQVENSMNGEGFNWRSVATVPFYAAAGEGFGRVIGAAIGGAIRRISGKPVNVFKEDGTLTDDAIKTLNDAGVSPDQADEIIKQHLLQVEGVTPEQVERFDLFRRYGMQPTRAQVTQSAGDFQQQQDLVKTSGAVRNRIEGQNQHIYNMMDDTSSNMAGSGNVYDATAFKATQLDDEISKLYEMADQRNNNGKVIKIEGLVDRMRRTWGANDNSTGMIAGMRGYLREMGIIDDNWRVVGRIDARTAQEIRAELNSYYKSTSNRGTQLMYDYKNLLDDDVFRAGGGDIYRQASDAKASFEQGLRHTKLNKFDSRDKSLVGKVLNNEINGDEFFQKGVLSRSWRDTDLAEVKSYLNSGTPDQRTIGANAWSDLRRETMDWIRNQSFRGTPGETDVAEFSYSKIDAALKRIGDKKLSVIFDRDELDFLTDMVKIARVKLPVWGTALGKGPTGQAVEELGKLIKSDNNFITGFLKNLAVSADGRLMVNTQDMVESAVRTAQSTTGAQVQGGVSSGGAAIANQASNSLQEYLDSFYEEEN